jgi:hypothetical protein
VAAYQRLRDDPTGTATQGDAVSTEGLTEYPTAHQVTVPFRTLTPTPEGQREMQQIRTIQIDDKLLCLPMDGKLCIEPMVGAAGHRVTVEIWADSVMFEPNSDL